MDSQEKVFKNLGLKHLSYYSQIFFQKIFMLYSCCWLKLTAANTIQS